MSILKGVYKLYVYILGEMSVNSIYESNIKKNIHWFIINEFIF